MKPKEISELLKDCVSKPSDIGFVGFPKPDRGWYINGTGAETRAESETRAAKFYLWLCEYLDEQLRSAAADIFDAGVAVPGEEHECEHDKVSPRQRRRRTILLVGHGDFMSLVLKRVVAGFGYSVENENVPHRSAFTHFNTGLTELEYFGRGRFLILASNQTPHIHPNEYSKLRSGGSLKDGWSYLVPNDAIFLHAEVKVAFVDELDDHVREQTEALKSLYLSSNAYQTIQSNNKYHVEEETPTTKDVHFTVQSGHQVVGCATYNEDSGHLYDVAVRPSIGEDCAQTLIRSVIDHHCCQKRSNNNSLIVHPRSEESKVLFKNMGFIEMVDEESENSKIGPMKLKH